ncbi:MAG: FMN-binding negative transcriptional regulator [Deltaproteobacteria bacterium]|nr:FMN-binding negative transcriptional regulator [Deltaproteobacteria bacterium]
MYLPKLFENPERAQLVELMRAHPFATVLALRDEAPEISHLPVLVARDSPLTLHAHVARANPLGKLVAEGARLTVIFHGPHCYVSPRLYKNADNVPTWNYAVVHASGRARVLPPDAALAHLTALAARFESNVAEPWAPAHAGDLAQELVPALVAFELEVEQLSGKFKLSQNRKPEDWQGVVDAFERSPNADERAVLTLMKRQGPPR